MTPKSSQDCAFIKNVSDAVYGNAHMMNLVELENAQIQQGRIRELDQITADDKACQSDGGAFEMYIPKRQIKAVKTALNKELKRFCFKRSGHVS